MMKKTILVGLLMLAFGLPSIGWGSTVGNIAETQGSLWKFSLGVEYDGVFDRNMEWDSGTLSRTQPGATFTEPFPWPGASIEDIEADSSRLFFKGTLGLHPNVDIFVKLGTANANWEAKLKDPGFPDEKLEFEDDSDFAWGIGAKVKIFETPGGLRFMADAQYMSYEVDGVFKVDGVTFEQMILDELLLLDPTATFSSESKTEIVEWQVAFYVNQTFGNFSPYIGVKYSDLNADFALDGSGQVLGAPVLLTIDGESEAEDNIGLFLGTDIYIVPNQFSVNIEVRFIDETAGTIGVNYRF